MLFNDSPVQKGWGDSPYIRFGWEVIGLEVSFVPIEVRILVRALNNQGRMRVRLRGGVKANGRKIVRGTWNVSLGFSWQGNGC